ncbi:hypothetical protein BDV38DRAFT_251825, partial [Aspergillus pseudotamarii]
MRSPVPWHGRNDDRQLLKRSGRREGEKSQERGTRKTRGDEKTKVRKDVTPRRRNI